eukprot:TRINITY_DN8072_c0_g1_i2.p2 TRINITY_DN8072_c0_g1~~TRINITY_DN8072_c0_g1_i2.p2  ORF type:complete len:110 (+),score=8.80 TRINITY_DN8072_c0_g1_i2:120-449(+)
MSPHRTLATWRLRTCTFTMGPGLGVQVARDGCFLPLLLAFFELREATKLAQKRKQERQREPETMRRRGSSFELKASHVTKARREGVEAKSNNERPFRWSRGASFTKEVF